MKIRDGFMIREVAGQWIVVPLGERLVEFNGIMTLSGSGALLWKSLAQDVSEEDLVNTLLAEYDIDEESARTDIQEFLAKLWENGLME